MSAPGAKQGNGDPRNADKNAADAKAGAASAPVAVPAAQASAASASPNVVMSPSGVSVDYAVKHPLQRKWTFWFDNPGRKVSQNTWEAHLRRIASVDTVEDFWRLFNNVVPPSRLPSGSNMHCFRDPVQPKWEDPENKGGGKWIVTLPRNKKDQLDKYWLYICLAMVGEDFGEASGLVCGCVISIRKTQDKVSLWTRRAVSEPEQVSIGKRMRLVLELADGQPLSYQFHDDSIKRNSSFNNQTRYQA